MKTSIRLLALFMMSAAFCHAQSTPNEQDAAEAALRQAFVGRQIALKVDMPGTQKGVDLDFTHTDPMNWQDYENRTKEFGVALHKGDRATVTSIVVKNDHIEFHLDGGGYGTAHDDTGSVTARIIPKSDEQERLEKALKTESDKDRKRDLQQRIDREQSRRNFLQTQENSAAAVAQQIKQREIADRRLHGGSRFNLRWKGNIPPDDLRTEAVHARLDAFVDFDAAPAPPPQPMAQPAPPPATGNDSITALHRGMSFNELQGLLGPGQIISQETSSSGLLNQELLYQTPTSQVRATLVDGILIRYAIESR